MDSLDRDNPVLRIDIVRDVVDALVHCILKIMIIPKLILRIERKIKKLLLKTTKKFFLYLQKKKKY